MTGRDEPIADRDLPRLLFRWFHHEMAGLWRRSSGVSGQNIRLLMGCPLWNMTYIQRFGNYCLPTIVSPKNLAALNGRCRLVLYTDEAGLQPLMEMTRPLKNWGIDPILCEIPPDIMQAMEKHKYQLLGMVQNVLVQMAGRQGLAFHALQPDHVHGSEYYENLFRIAEKADAIVQTGISANIVTAAKDIEKFRQPNGELTIPDRDLGDIGWRHLHKQMKMYCMNGASIPKRLPNSHYVFWQGRDKITIYCCHMNPAYISPRLCEIAPFPKSLGALVSTIDTKLPVLLRGSVYVVEADDGMTFIEVSDDDKPAAPSFVSAEDFVSTGWRQTKFSNAYMPYFQQLCEIPIHPKKKFATDEQIKTQHAQLVKLLIAGKTRVMEKSLHEMIGAI